MNSMINYDSEGRFKLMDFEDHERYFFNDNLNFKERSQANRKYKHSKKSPKKQLRPDYHISNRFELMDFD